ncbi:hypothetical protein MBLNU457_4477t1 [Dothideomycetes sp. NU457]
MVKERIPGQPSSAPTSSASMPQSADQQSQKSFTGEQASPPSTLSAVARPPQQAEFGKASPLRNPHKPANIFNPNPRKAELHRPKPSSSATGDKKFYLPGPTPANPPYKPPTISPTGTSAASNQSGPVKREGFYLPGQKRQIVSQSTSGAALTADFFDGVKVSAPVNPTYRSIPAAPKPMFSSLGPKTTFIPPKSRTIDLTGDADDGFDPDAAFKDDRFGAIDPYNYLDPMKASDDIKALLEGAFDDEGEKPRIRLRKRARKSPQDLKQQEAKLKTLEEKLASLTVQGDEKPKEDLKAEDDAEEDQEDGTVDGLAVKLLPHQVEGVQWMIDKEIGEGKKGRVLPYGGILADDMGLGKTIQSVSLILTNPRPALDEKAPEGSKRKMPGKEIGKGTLVVAPLALIKQWEAEIKTRVEKTHALKVLVHHGPSRTKSAIELKKYDVVITTYQILSSEHAGSSDHAEGIKVGCFGVQWYRVILDEAHSIKNRNAKSTQACCALRSHYRWCLTGTPMQNNLDELQSLVNFLRIKPYNELAQWKLHITGPMKNGKGNLAIRRVQAFLKGFMKRRTKDILKEEGALNFGGKSKDPSNRSQGMKIVERKIETIVCELEAGERAFYDKLAERANNRLQEMMSGEKNDYIGALVLLLRLRQACNHPQLIEAAMKSDTDALATAGIGGNQSPRKGGAATTNDVDDLADMFGGLGVASKACDVCQAKLSSTEIDQGAVRCAGCNDVLSGQKALKKEHKHKHKNKSKSGKGEVKKVIKQRARKIIHDSDDDDEEGEGEWLVNESQQEIYTGKAGGTDDEDAEGGGRDLGSEDSETDSEESDDDMQRINKHGDTSLTSVDESFEVSSGSDSDESVAARNSHHMSRSTPSTKIRRLLKILKADTPDHKVIVFSQFTSMLNLIEPHLTHARIPFVRYDGSMRNDAREAALHSLRTDPRTRVLLCSLKCGSLGLNLTAASRVVIVEPFWNPFVEEQAIDRVHRLNQTIDVKVYKLTVSNTVEERILELQEKKRQLANAAIEGGKSIGKLSMRDILGLFGSNAEMVAPGGIEVPQKSELLKQQVQGDLRQQIRGTVAVGSSQRTPPMMAQADRRRFAEKPRSRPSAEDPVYGRR